MKRLFDFTAALLGLIVLALPLLILALLVRYKLGHPVLFRQPRGGMHGQSFDVIKFRSMTDERGADGQLLPDAVRLTPFGRFLRAASLDELPGLWNVLKGDMSLVGPRPLLREYLSLYTPEQARRHEVRPGITGWAQINGRNTLSWEERLELDVWYVDNRSLWLDLKIIWRTIPMVLLRHGITTTDGETIIQAPGEGQTSHRALTAHAHKLVVGAANHVPMSRFTGSESSSSKEAGY